MKKASLCALTILVLSLTAMAAEMAPANQFQRYASATASARIHPSTEMAPRPGEGDPAPTCYPGKNCGQQDQIRVIAGEGDPAPTCYPGKNCGQQDQIRMIAGEGDPAPTCYPGKNCGQQGQIRVIAGEGDPAPTCYPGKNCGQQDQIHLLELAA
jgi:fructose-1,6-bisphosphatase/sedoheptulose 1,7-bisphosphatase-like protein